MFDNAEVFDPSRWFNADKQSAEWNALFMPFSQGIACVRGEGLGYDGTEAGCCHDPEAVRRRHWPDMKEDDMDMIDHFLVIPKGGRCNLLFAKRPEKK